MHYLLLCLSLPLSIKKSVFQIKKKTFKKVKWWVMWVRNYWRMTYLRDHVSPPLWQSLIQYSQVSAYTMNSSLTGSTNTGAYLGHEQAWVINPSLWSSQSNDRSTKHQEELNAGSWSSHSLILGTLWSNYPWLAQYHSFLVSLLPLWRAFTTPVFPASP